MWILNWAVPLSNRRAQCSTTLLVTVRFGGSCLCHSLWVIQQPTVFAAYLQRFKISTCISTLPILRRWFTGSDREHAHCYSAKGGFWVYSSQYDHDLILPMSSILEGTKRTQDYVRVVRRMISLRESVEAWWVPTCGAKRYCRHPMGK